MPKPNSGDDLATPDEIEETFNYDPFDEENNPIEGEPLAAAPAAAPVPPGETPPVVPPVEPPTVPQPPATPPAAPEVPPAPPAPPAPPEPTMADVMALVSQQGRTIQALSQRLEQPPGLSRTAPGQPQVPGGAPRVPGGPPQGQPDPTQYAFNIPDEVVNAIRSDDMQLAKQGLSTLLGGMAGAVHERMYESISTGLTPIIERTMHQHASEQGRRQAMHQDFYGTYKVLDHPQIKPMVAAAANQIAQEWGTQEWSPQMRDEVYRRVVGTLNSVQTAVGVPPAAPGAFLPAAPTIPAPTVSAAGPTVLGSPGALLPAGVPPAILDGGPRPPASLPGNAGVADQVEEMMFGV